MSLKKTPSHTDMHTNTHSLTRQYDRRNKIKKLETFVVAPHVHSYNYFRINMMYIMPHATLPHFITCCNLQIAKMLAIPNEEKKTTAPTINTHTL